MEARLGWAEKTWVNHVDLDESYVLTTTLNRKLKVPPGFKRPIDRLKSKSNISKVMFITAVARPRPEHNFDGKIGMWRVVMPYVAKRTSKLHHRGQRYMKDVTLNARLFQKTVLRKIFPAIRRKMPFTKRVIVQMDNAKPHVGGKTVDVLNKAGRGKKENGPTIKMLLQPAQSPDTNALDLGFFKSMLCRLQRSSKGKSIGALLKNSRKIWKKYPEEILEKIFVLKTKVLELIIDDKGGNSFEITNSK